MKGVDEKVKRIAARVKEHLVEIYGEKIKDVMLYGSHVRGEATPDSDVDILVLVDESLNPSEVRKSLSDLLLDILLEEGELVSVIVLPHSFFESHDYPFILSVRRESIRV